MKRVVLNSAICHTGYLTDGKPPRKLAWHSQQSHLRSLTRPVLHVTLTDRLYDPTDDFYPCNPLVFVGIAELR